jgi:hypothetical protein
MRAALAVLCSCAAGWSWAGEVHEKALEEPPPPPGMHKLSRAEANARVRPGSGAAAIFAVPQDEAAQKSAAALGAELEDALASRGTQMVDLDALFPPPPAASVTRGEDLFKEGRNAYDNLDVDRAAEKFNQAITFYAKHPVETRPHEMGRVLVFLGASLALNGDATAAKDAFQRALLVDPAAKPDSELFGRDVQKAFAAAKADLAQREKGVLHVESIPPRARVWIRGEPKGQTPVADLSLTAGRHQLLIRRPGYVPFGAFPDVKAGQSTDVEAVLEATGGLAAMQATAAKLTTAAALESSKVPPEAKAMGERLGARYLILAQVGRAGSKLYAWDLSTGDKLSAVPVESADATAGQVLSWIEHPPSFSLLEHVPGVAKRWWFWAGVAGAAAVVTGVVVVSSGHPHSVFPGGVPY